MKQKRTEIRSIVSRQIQEFDRIRELVGLKFTLWVWPWLIFVFSFKSTFHYNYHWDMMSQRLFKFSSIHVAFKTIIVQKDAFAFTLKFKGRTRLEAQGHMHEANNKLFSLESGLVMNKHHFIWTWTLIGGYLVISFSASPRKWEIFMGHCQTGQWKCVGICL